MPVSLEREREFIRAAMEFLAEVESATRKEVLNHVEQAVPPTADERRVNPKSGRVDWQLRVLWASTGLVKAGYITKDGSGTWTVTDKGREALVRYPDPAAFKSAVDSAYREWAAANKPAQRRAWLVRGSSVLGINVVPEWLEHDFCSLAGSQLRPIPAGIDAGELRELATEDYGHLKHHELKAKVDEIVAFVTKMSIGDVVITTSDQHTYVGDVTGDWTYEQSEGGRSNLRRAVDWRNEDAPIDFAELPAPLPARCRLETRSSISQAIWR